MLPGMALDKDPRDKEALLTVKVDPEKLAAWHAHAKALHTNLSELTRSLLDRAAASKTAGVEPPGDAAFRSALEELYLATDVLDRASIIRMAVMSAWRRRRAGVDPWFPAPVEEAPRSTGSPDPDRPAGKGRR